MTRWRWLSLAVSWILILWAHPAHGCRYNVREIGFIDTGIEPYTLFVYVPQDVTPGEIDRLTRTVDSACVDTNIRFEAVQAGVDTNHPAARFLALHDIDDYPAAVLVSPDGPSRRLPLNVAGRSLAESVTSSLEAALESPVRRQILEKCAESYGVVLLIEGPDAETNTAARAAISMAASYVTGQLEYLPKPIAKGPTMCVLDRASLVHEELLLWTLGLSVADVNEPCAAIFYGRGRWIGPLFKGERLTDENLLRVLPLIGADCECGLDHRWLQGTMLPLRWDAGLQQRVAASLGFDPESPLVRMEMVSIVRRGMGGWGPAGTPDPGVESSGYSSTTLGYQELEVHGGPTIPESNDTTSTPTPESDLGGVVESPRRVGSVLAMSLGGAVVVVAVMSAVVLLRAKRD